MVLTKFESKSVRVKGLAFHSLRPWLLASLHTGTIQLWDYRVCSMIEKYEEHDGPVRGIDFHLNQPLFVSGGDDYKIRVWNHSVGACLFTLHGHLDYVRSVFFHCEQPWLLSASDDQTIRVWNWQSRSCICVLTGHNHYVMCAQFHPQRSDLIVSCSLDQTVRVWDLSGLRKKTVPEAVVKFVLEGHERGVNWVAFHPTLPFVASAADDRFVKIWRFDESRAYEVDCLRGHFNNISCVLFSSNGAEILSNSEDRCLKVWSFAKRTCVHTIRRESDRFWTLTKHPSLNLFAAGHDSGFVLFKLKRERPAFTLTNDNDQLIYVKEQTIRRLTFAQSKDVALRPIQTSNNVFSISLNPTLRTAIVVYRSEEDDDHNNNGHYVIVNLSSNEEQSTAKRCRSAIYLSKSKYAVLTKDHLQIMSSTNQQQLRSFKLKSFRREMFAVPSSANVLLAEGDRGISLVDTNQSELTIIKSLKVKKVKHVYWSANGQKVAIVNKNQIVIADPDLKVIAKIEDTCRIKSAIWIYQDDLLLYTSAWIPLIQIGDSIIVNFLICDRLNLRVVLVERT